MGRHVLFHSLAVSALLAGAAYGQSVGGVVGGVVREVGGVVSGATGGSGAGGGGSGGGIGGIDGVGGMAGDLINRTVERTVLSGGDRMAGTLAGLNEDMVEPNLNRRGWVTVDPLEEMFLNFDDLRRQRLDALVHDYPKELEFDSVRNPVRKGELIAVDPQPAAVAQAIAAGLKVSADERDVLLGIRTVTFKLPRGTSAQKAMLALKRIPGLAIDYNHIYEPAGGALKPAKKAPLARAISPATVRPGTRLVMIDGGVASHPAFRGATIEQRGFAGPAEATGHGTAVGSLLVGQQDAFRGAARGAQLYVADVYSGKPQAGSATAIFKALSWAASKNPKVINISLVGPPNALVARGIAAVQRRGIAVVAAVGNDGPSAPIQYPASYPGVVAVTGVDQANRVLIEAGRSRHVSFAAPGADLVAAAPGNHFIEVRGTSFAAPLTTARLAAQGTEVALRREAQPGSKGDVGFGIVCRRCTLSPKLFKNTKPL